MQYEDYLTDAINLVSAWDLPDEDFATVVTQQAKLMAGMSPEDILEDQPETL